MPDDTLISWIGAPQDSQMPLQKTTANHSHIVAYLPNTTSTYTGIVMVSSYQTLKMREVRYEAEVETEME